MLGGCTYVCMYVVGMMVSVLCSVLFIFFFFKQKTAYEMRISDWSSDVCSSDLLERIEKLGGIGDVVNVKNGFARNYLLPNNKALRANDTNRKLFEANRAKIESDNAERRGEAEVRSKEIGRAHG